MVLNFLRFRQRPPGKTPPPNNRVDVFHDPEAGKLVARDSQGNPVLFDSAAGGATWGAITGTLASQTDLAAAMAAKAPLISPSFTTPSLGAAVMNESIVPDTDSSWSIGSGTRYLLNAYADDVYCTNVNIGYSATGTGVGRVYFYGVGGNSIEITGTPTANRTQTIPDTSGTLGVLRAYADSTAANAAVSVGDAWWDTTLNKARVRLT